MSTRREIEFNLMKIYTEMYRLSSDFTWLKFSPFITVAEFAQFLKYNLLLLKSRQKLSDNFFIIYLSHQS